MEILVSILAAFGVFTLFVADSLYQEYLVDMAVRGATGLSFLSPEFREYVMVVFLRFLS